MGLKITTMTSEKAMEIAQFVYEKTGKYYETHSAGFCQNVTHAHAELIAENFKGQGVRIDGKLA